MADETSPGIRSARARLGALALHAQGKTTTEAARAAFKSKFLSEVDPSGILSEAERERRAQFAQKAHYVRLALRSAEARRARSAQKARAVNKTTASGQKTPDAATREEDSVSSTAHGAPLV